MKGNIQDEDYEESDEFHGETLMENTTGINKDGVDYLQSQEAKKILILSLIVDQIIWSILKFSWEM